MLQRSKLEYNLGVQWYIPPQFLRGCTGTVALSMRALESYFSEFLAAHVQPLRLQGSKQSEESMGMITRG